MGRFVTSISILKDLRDEALEAAKSGKYPGISDFSSIVEFALEKLLHPNSGSSLSPDGAILGPQEDSPLHEAPVHPER